MKFAETIGLKKDTDVSLYTVVVDELDPFAIGKKARDQDETIQLIKTLEGFVGVHPVVGRATLLLFDTRVHAETARAALDTRGLRVGNNVTEVYVPRQYVPEEMITK